MKKLMSLTAAMLMCLSLLIYVPHGKACEVEIPECTEETVIDTVQPLDAPDYQEEHS